MVHWRGAVPLAEAPAWVVAPLVASPRRDVGPPIGPVAECLLGRAFQAAGWWLRTRKEKAIVTCPWEHLHSTGKRGDSSTVLLPPTASDPNGRLWCSHTHREGRNPDDVLAALPAEALEAAEAGRRSPTVRTRRAGTDPLETQEARTCPW